MKQERLNLYYMDIKYVRDLHKADNNVQSVSPQIHKSKRPFVGVLVVCDNNEYCVPLDSPKEKHRTMRNAIDFMRVYHDGKIIGVLNFNNMIPVDRRFIKKVDVKIRSGDSLSDKHYKELCVNELTWCRKNQEKIVIKANKLYRLVQQPTCSARVKKRCNDFKKLEKILDKKKAKS